MFEHRHLQGHCYCRVSGGEDLECRNAGAGTSNDYPTKKKEQGLSPTAEGLVGDP